MNKMNTLFLFGLIIILLDIPFITYVLGPKYHALNMALNPKIIYAVCAYIIMISSWFLIEGDVYKAFLTGLGVYGTYAFTLAAILPGYSLSFAMTEILWGTFLFIIATIITNKIKLV